MSSVLRQRPLDASPDFPSVKELGLPRAPSASWSHKRDRANVEVEDANDPGLETPT